MSTVSTIPQESRASSSKMLVAMVGIGTICALLIAVVYEGTLDRIALLQAKALEAAVFRVLPGTSSTAVFALTDSGRFAPAGEEAGRVVYAGYNDQGELTGVAVEGAGQGYAGMIRILVGYNPASETVVGFYVLQSNETPGLGDKIEKDENFLANFSGLDVSLANGQLKNRVVPVKNGTKTNPWEVEAITGATISSRAIAAAIDADISAIIPMIHEHQQDFQKTTQ